MKWNSPWLNPFQKGPSPNDQRLGTWILSSETSEGDHTAEHTDCLEVRIKQGHPPHRCNSYLSSQVTLHTHARTLVWQNTLARTLVWHTHTHRVNLHWWSRQKTRARNSSINNQWICWPFQLIEQLLLNQGFPVRISIKGRKEMSTKQGKTIATTGIISWGLILGQMGTSIVPTSI